jgi:riboflavin kinase/FMN adenylyltransferase
MRVYRGIPAQAAHATALTIGNFDGVHRGHQALLGRLVSHARARGLPAAVMTFEPHPREFFARRQGAAASVPPRLCSLREKLALLEADGVDEVYVCRFDAAFAARSAEHFVADLLVAGLGVQHLLIGDDFRFGAGRRGDFAMLQAAGARHGFSVEAMHTVDFQGERVSSSALRDALAEGDLAHAERLLGRPYAVSGRVTHGRKIGRQLGFPTANIQLRGRRLALAGVFAVTVSGEDLCEHPGAASVGVRPTLEAGLQPTCEVYLLDFDGDLYHRHLTLTFRVRLRDEARFDSLEALKAAIAADVAATRAYFSDPFHFKPTTV